MGFFSGFLAIPKPTKGNGQHGHHSEEPKERSSSNPSIQTEEKQVKLKKNVDLFSGIALIVGTMIGKSLKVINSRRSHRKSKKSSKSKVNKVISHQSHQKSSKLSF